MNHRRPKSFRREKEAKEIRRLYQEHRKLWHQKSHAPLIELKEPYVRGYERFFVLTPQAQRRADSDKLAIALTFFQNHELCRKGWFRGSLTARKHWARGEVGPHFPQRPQLSRLIKRSFPRKLYPFVRARSVDLEDGLPPVRQLKRNQLQERVKFRYFHLLESHIQPHWVTHLRVLDPELEARLSYLKSKLWGEGNYAVVSKVLGWRRWRYDFPTHHERSSRDDFKRQLQEANSDPTIQSAVSPRFFVSLNLVLTKAVILTGW